MRLWWWLVRLWDALWVTPEDFMSLSWRKDHIYRTGAGSARPWSEE